MTPVDGAPRNRNPDGRAPAPVQPAPQARPKARSGFKVAVIDELVAKGLGRREAARAVKAIVEAMKDAVKRGEVVETPFGTLNRKLVRRRRRLGRPGFGGKLKWMKAKPPWRMVFRAFPEYRE
jgi:nucleoid DNA-binding protein